MCIILVRGDKSIKLDNYVTFIHPTEIDFTATNYKFLEEENVGANHLLKGCLFVGENASGKTKILKSITFLLDLLFRNNEVNFMPNRSFFTEQPTYKLEYTFIEENVEITYKIELGIEEIISEKLLLDHQVILERLGNTAKFRLNEEKTFYDLSNKLLFLRRIYFDTHFYNHEILNKWFDYMRKSVYINCYNRMVFAYSGDHLLVHEYLDHHNVDEMNQFLTKINYKQQIEYGVETSDPNNKFLVRSDDNQKFISFNKENTDIFIPEMFESTGNQTLIELLPSFLHAIKNECMLIIDEFSSGFHNELEECMIKYFFPLF